MNSEKIKQARSKLGLTQSQMAKLLGYGAVARVSEIENGSRDPGISVVRLLQAYLEGYRPDDWPDMGIHADPGVTTCIQCDVELEAKGPTDKAAVSLITHALRELADQVEADRYEDGHHELKSKLGERVGTVYFDFSEEHKF